MFVEPFQPDINRIYRKTISSSSQDIPIQGNGDRAGLTVRIRCHVTGDETYFAWGPVTATAVAASTSSMGMEASSVETFTLPAGTTHIACVSAAGSGTVEITVGNGS